MWQARSSHCCWNCCHKFDNVPAYLPSRDKNGKFLLSGNFCSWNCAKAYALSLHTHKPKGAEFIGLFGFLTVHRPKHCPTPVGKTHSPDCPCLSLYHPLVLPPSRNQLQMFGGPLSIRDFQKGFAFITDYSVIPRLFRIDGPAGKTRPYLYELYGMAGSTEPEILRSRSTQPTVVLPVIREQKTKQVLKAPQDSDSEEEGEPHVYRD